MFFVLFVAACTEEPPPPIEEQPLDREVLFDAAVPVSLQDVFDDPDQAVLFTVISGHEIKDELRDESLLNLPRLDEWYIYDRADLGLGAWKELADSFKQAVVAGEYNSKPCIFAPHHVLRLSKGVRVLEIIVCFRCHEFKVLPEGGYKNVCLSTEVGMESTWRKVVADKGLRDYSLVADEVRKSAYDGE